MKLLKLFLAISLFLGANAFAGVLTVGLDNPVYLGNRNRKTQYIDLDKILAQQGFQLKDKLITKIEVWGYTSKYGATFFISEKSKVLAANKFAKSKSPFGDNQIDGVWGYSKVETEPVPWPFVRVWTIGEVWLYKVRITSSDIPSPTLR